MLGKSSAMRAVFDLVTRVASSTANVLINGESGTGKEMVARAIHSLGPRASKPFVAINCTAIPETLLESELFGAKAGAYTGAVRDRLLGRPVSDIDWVVVGASAEAMQAQGFRPVGADFPVFLHPDSGEEYALARTERKSGQGYGGFTFHASPDVTLEEDLIRRDLTINAIPTRSGSRASRIGLSGVAEPCALATAKRRDLVVGKTVIGGVTIAIAR